ncbi:MAG: MBL fold metallo-hydrolase [Bryobacteraceae bacterium]|jgi:L-ascorbate metabolism protein UlaG (beta-lactamase superfamily)
MKTAVLALAVAIAAPCANEGDLFSTALGPVMIAPVHHASLVIQGAGRVVYVDPSSEANYRGFAKADLVLITAADADHFDPAIFARGPTKNAPIIGPVEIGTGLKRFTALENGGTVQVGDITIQAVASYRSGTDAKTIHEPHRGNGYVLTYPGLRVYISGRTALIPEMKSLKNIDVAFLSVGTPGALSLDDAAQAMLLIKPKTVYPYQYGQTSLDDIRRQLLHAVPGVEVRVRNWYE